MIKPKHRLAVALCLHAHASLAATFDPGDNPPYASALLQEVDTGRLLFEHNADLRRSPASTQKLLLQLVVMDLITASKLSLEEEVLVSARASLTGGSQVFLAEGETFTLRELMEAVAIPSANDACVAIAEHAGGSVEGFVAMMNDRAHSLGLENTTAVNVHGLDDTPRDNGNRTSARDLAVISATLMRYPQVLGWSAIRYKPFRNGEFMLYTTNKLLGKFRGVDGLKTGYTQRAGSCLVATAKRQGMRLLSVVLGSKNEHQRDKESRRLLSWGFNNFTKTSIVQAGEPLGTVALDWGLEPQVEVVARDSVNAVLGFMQEHQLVRKIELSEEIPAPVMAGQGLGKLTVTLGDSLLTEVDLVAARSVRRMTVWEMFLSYF